MRFVDRTSFVKGKDHQHDMNEKLSRSVGTRFRNRSVRPRGMHRHVRAWSSLIAGLGVVIGGAFASDVEERAATWTSLAVYPSQVRLDSRDDTQRVLIVATEAEGRTVEVASRASIQIEPGDVATVQHTGSGPTLMPLSDGTAVLTVVVGDQQASATVEVRGAGAPRPVGFRNDVLPVFMKAGCNTGGCHGSAEGKEGFRLSLFGFEPQKDYVSLTRDMTVRRLDFAQPRESLLLRKPLGEAEHGGGQRLQPDSPMMHTLLRWIEARAPDDPADAPRLSHIEVLPARCILDAGGQTQPLIVRAFYSDGSDRDVTPLALYDSSDTTTAVVSEEGIVTSGTRGEAYIMARYGSFAVVSQLIVRDGGRAYTWPDHIAARNEIDEAVFAKLRTLHVRPAEPAADGVFLRRVYLDVLGVLPTVEEYRAFMDDPSPDKRARLIDALLERREFADLWAMKWAELLRIESGSRRLSLKAMHLYGEWLRNAIRARTPLDHMVRELLTAEGGAFTHPAANFYVGESQPALMAENVAQVFLGIRIQCAQCHNHPFERWTQDDYYGFAAFFAQIGRKPGADPRETVVFNSGGGEVRHPRTGEVVAPKYLGGPAPDCRGRDRRVVLADWLTSPENPYFAACFVDRVWAHFFGRGIVDPPDDVRVSNPPSHPELRERLARRFVASGYDLRDLVRTICNSYTYQMAVAENEEQERDVRHFAAAKVRRLPAEVLLDAVCSVTQSPEKFAGLPLGARAVEVTDANAGSFFLSVFGRPSRLSACTCERRDEPTLSQALHLLNGATLAAKLADDNGRLARQIAAQTPPQAAIEELYLSALSRPPTREELTLLIGTYEQSPDKRRALEDIYWAVLNSKEFLFNH